MSRRTFVAAAGVALAGCEAPTAGTAGTHSPISEYGPSVAVAVEEHGRVRVALVRRCVDARRRRGGEVFDDTAREHPDIEFRREVCNGGKCLSGERLRLSGVAVERKVPDGK